MTDPFYRTAAWLKLRAAVKKRSRGMCEAPGCTSRGVVVDHIVSRRRGGPDAMHNLRNLCRTCDNRIKEDTDGNRRGGGNLNVGCDATGLPIDRAHPFFGVSAGGGGFEQPNAETADRRCPRSRSKFPEK